MHLNSFRSSLSVLVAAHTMIPCFPGNAQAAEKVDFNRDIRPLLSDHCYACHGPDEKGRKADLRLDLLEGTKRTADNGLRIIEPGDADRSALFVRISTDNHADLMPPPEFNLQLDQAQIDLIKRWINEGAKWGEHWAFAPLVPTKPPRTLDPNWPRNEIDRFILSRLETEGLRPADEARKERLLRRVTLDLTGLPPTLEELDAFLADDSPGAYEQAVDRLLASPAYGERMALEWLDVARYADTYGYQADRFNHLWPWRDWVARAFNGNLGYDMFITWQLAGDLLPNATREQRLATAFNRNHRQTNEGGSINEEFRVEYNADRVKTMGLAFMGLSLECARCHDHKYDPISQKDYYSLFGFFNSTDESGLYSHFTDSIPNPTLLLYPDDATESRHKALQRQIAEASAKRQAASVAESESFKDWLSAKPRLDDAIPGLVGSFSFDAIEKNQVANAANAKAPGALRESPKLVAGKFDKALEFTGENSVDIANIANFDRDDPFSLSLWIRTVEKLDRIVVLHRCRAGSDAGSRGYELLLEDGRAAFGLTHFWPGNAMKITTRKELPLNQWVHVGVTYDGSSRASGLRIFLDGKPEETAIQRDSLFKTIAYEKEKMNVPLQLAARFRGRGFKDGRIDELKIFNRELSALEMRSLGTGVPLPATLKGAATAALRELHRLRFDPELTQQAAALRKLRAQENDLINKIPEIMAMGDLPTPRPTYVLSRGVYDAPAERVNPGVPESFLTFDPDLPRNRLGLAKWLTDPRHPLTARVTVNRYWQLFFGRGVCATTEEVGSQGERPTHPELITWLAKDFIDSGWNTKALHKKIVMSATYRQSSIGSAKALQLDPENKLLARGPGHRWSAETIRNNALAAAGMLRHAMGGPSDQSHDQAGHRGAAKKDVIGKSFRRSLYLYVKRTAPSPYLITFDGTSREDCIARRQQTNTPLQALVTLNDELFNEASRRLADRMVTEGGKNLTAQIQFAFRSLTGRRANQRELDILRQLHDEQLELFRSAPEAAHAFLSQGGKGNADKHTIELAALAVVANAIMNFDETLMKR